MAGEAVIADLDGTLCDVSEILHLVDPARRMVHLTRMVWQGDGQMGLQFIDSRAFTEPLGGAEGAGRVVEMVGPWPKQTQGN